MKKILFFSFLALALFFSGCVNNGDDNAKAKIVGKWFLIKEVELEYHNGAEVDEFVDIDFTDENYIEFKSDGEVIFSEQGGTETATYSINSAGSKLTITHSPGDTDEINIKSMNSRDLIFRQEDSEVRNGKTIKYVYESYFKKK